MTRLLNTLFAAIAIYVAVFALWLLMAMGCIDYAGMHNEKIENVCGDDLLTQTVRVTHRPVIELLEYLIEIKNNHT